MSDIIEAAARALRQTLGVNDINSATVMLAAVTPLIENAAYRERNQVVAALARLFPSGLARTDISGWEPEWHGAVYIDLPTGQVWFGLGGPPVERIKVRKVDPLKGQEIGRFCVSQCDADLLEHEWQRHDAGYWTRQPHLSEPNGYLHLIIAKRIWGEIPYGYEVDHIDRDNNNITRSNLRLATPRGNKHNQRPRNGVRQKPSGKWSAQINGLEKYTHIGTFDTETEARAAYATAKAQIIRELHGAGDYIYPPLQISWHYHDNDAQLFNGLPAYTKPWDGHDTPEKYRRLAALAQASIEAAALERAAKVAEEWVYAGTTSNIAAAIRALIPPAESSAARETVEEDVR